MHSKVQTLHPECSIGPAATGEGILHRQPQQILQHFSSGNGFRWFSSKLCKLLLKYK